MSQIHFVLTDNNSQELSFQFVLRYFRKYQLKLISLQKVYCEFSETINTNDQLKKDLKGVNRLLHRINYSIKIIVKNKKRKYSDITTTITDARRVALTFNNLRVLLPIIKENMKNNLSLMPTEMRRKLMPKL